MSYAFVNYVQNSTDGTVLNTATAPAISVTAGNRLFVLFQHENSTANLGVTLTDGTNTYTDVFGAELAATDERCRLFTTVVQSTNAALVIVATLGSGALSGFRAFVVAQYSGLASSGTKDGGQLLLVTAPGTGTDGISNSGTNTTQPAALLSFATNDTGSTPPNAGTGFTSRGTFWDFTGTNGAGVLGRFEDKRVTTTASQAGTFTATSGEGSSVFRTATVLFDEATGGGTTYTLSVTSLSVPVAGKTINFPRAIKQAITFLAVPIVGKTLNAKYTLGIGALSVPVVGKNVTLTYSGHTNYSLSVTRLLVPVTGQTVNAKYTLGLSVTSIPIAAQSVTLTYTQGPRTLILTVGTAMVPIILGPAFADYSLGIAKLTVPVVGKPVTLTYTPAGTQAYVLSVSARSIPIAAQTVNFKMTHTLPVTCLLVPVVTQNVGLIYSPPLPPIVCAGGSFDSLTPMPGLMQ